jgi:N-glycosylase/DNA lyase
MWVSNWHYNFGMSRCSLDNDSVIKYKEMKKGEEWWMNFHEMCEMSEAKFEFL